MISIIKVMKSNIANFVWYIYSSYINRLSYNLGNYSFEIFPHIFDTLKTKQGHTVIKVVKEKVALIECACDSFAHAIPNSLIWSIRWKFDNFACKSFQKHNRNRVHGKKWKLYNSGQNYPAAFLQLYVGVIESCTCMMWGTLGREHFGSIYNIDPINAQVSQHLCSGLKNSHRLICWDYNYTHVKM
jgi:hypothetical protein